MNSWTMATLLAFAGGACLDFGGNGEGEGSDGGSGGDDTNDACDDCASDEVCDRSAGVCVECLRSSDCGEGESCIDQECVRSTGCESTSECSGDLVCDTTVQRCVECLANNHCPAGQVCSESSCVNEEGGGGGGTGGNGAGGSTSGGTAGTESGGSSSGGDANGGSENGGSANGGSASGGTSGAGGSSNGGSGGTGCECPSGQECTTDDRCVDPDVIDDFADCDESIYSVRGRSGGWYADADVGINVSHAVGTPPSGYSDRSCGAWTTGGPTGNGSTYWALLGASLAGGAPYDLGAYSGVTVSLEAQSVDLRLKTTNGGYFARRLPTTAGTQAYTVSFSEFEPTPDSQVSLLDLSQVTDIQFGVIDPTMGYGFVIHGIYLSP